MNMPKGDSQSLNRPEKVPPHEKSRCSAPKKMTAFSFALICCLPMANVSFGASPEDSENKKQYEQDMQYIKSVETRRDIKDYDAEFEKMADTIQRKWRQKNKERHTQLMLEVCRQISSGRFGDSREHGLARKYALVMLKKPDGLPIETEVRLLGHVVTDTILPSAPQGQEWSQQRREDVRARLHAWKRLNDSIDPTWDPKDMPTISSWRASEAMREKMKRYTQQLDARRLMEWFTAEAEKYIIRAYSKPPYDMNELREFLRNYVADNAAQTRILDAVAKAMEEAQQPKKQLAPQPRQHPTRIEIPTPLRSKPVRKKISTPVPGTK